MHSVGLLQFDMLYLSNGVSFGMGFWLLVLCVVNEWVWVRVTGFFEI
jgi:ABC-type uncharacterized transport system permease subunit